MEVEQNDEQGAPQLIDGNPVDDLERDVKGEILCKAVCAQEQEVKKKKDELSQANWRWETLLQQKHTHGQERMERRRAELRQERDRLTVRTRELPDKIQLEKHLLADSMHKLHAQRQRNLHHDGHFQVMGDPASRDRLVNGFKQLYDKTDLICQDLEKIFEHSRETQEMIESDATGFFIDTLHRVFCLAEMTFNESLNQVRSCFNIPSSCDLENDSGLVKLMKEHLRLMYRDIVPQVPAIILKGLEDSVRETNFFQALESAEKRRKTKHGYSGSYFPSDKSKPAGSCLLAINPFLEKSAMIAWYLQLLPGNFFVDARSKTFDARFHNRHAMSNGTVVHISEFFWPALLMQESQHHAENDHDQAICLLKGIVICITKESQPPAN